MKLRRRARTGPAILTMGVLMVFNTACSVVGIRNLEMPDYEVVEREGPFELREYPEVVVVETTSSGDFESAESSAFYRLFDYISGANEAGGNIEMTAPVIQEPASEKIEMTAPVFQDAASDGWRMAFVLPSRYTADTAPRPTDPDVDIRRMEPRRVAVVRFAGQMSPRAVEEQASRLERWMTARGLDAVSPPRSAGYDPPFTIPLLRRNEVMFDVEIAAGNGADAGANLEISEMEPQGA